MARDYMSIRLSYEAKFWLEKLQGHVQQVLDKSIDEKEIDDMEIILKEYLEKISDSLGGVSITNILKVSASSIIEKAYYYTENYSLEKWLEIDELVRNSKINSNLEVGTLTPRLYLDKEVINGLEQYRYDFKKDNMVRVVKMSYVIKNVLYAYHLEILGK
ncbi:hypothetical protein RU86_GL002140 [Lactococcus piscium]|uniref:Uncharacterized protein n=1 Tax=Pseudolactococcus piscium TaxID=1364 RepID=A0A2A5S0T7_9LACT|nr:hypothetical protein [Lactococcus piscium]PCS07028.1 hypothetical protein RU86_GL002140 [Lactococcus piscium]